MEGKITIIEGEIFVSIKGLEKILNEFFEQTKVVFDDMCRVYTSNTLIEFKAYVKKCKTDKEVSKQSNVQCEHGGQ